MILSIYIFDYTPLHFAAKFDYLSVVKYLVSIKADINAKTKMIEFFNIMRLLFILQLLMVILVL